MIVAWHREGILWIAAVVLAACSPSNAQFTCTLSNPDEQQCLRNKGDDNEHCVWCNVAGFGFCLGEAQAEKMEQNIPGVSCDRYSGTDDDKPAPTDDSVVPPTDDNVNPNTDDNVKPDTDDNVNPDENKKLWTCLQKKDSKTCLAASCTWCKSKTYGFGLCMTGPTADSAATSDFFECSTTPSSFYEAMTTAVKDPTDTSCLFAYVNDPTMEGCTSALDSDGTACEYCSVAGLVNICLTQEQAEMGNAYGISCQEEDIASATTMLRGTNSKLPQLQDPFDTSCLMEFLQDPTEEGCHAAVDSDGNTCEFCSYQGVQLCLNQDQAQAGEQFGMQCDATNNVNTNNNPYDPSCALAFLQDPTSDTCLSAVDQDGNACEYCTIQGALNLCLTQEQAQVGQSMGIDCDSTILLQEEQEGMPMDVLDQSCLLAQLNAGGTISPQDCTSTADEDGAPCEFCSIPGITSSLCLNAMQAQIATQFGGGAVVCGESAPAATKEDSDVSLPPDFFKCLQEYQQSDCDNNGCTWCNTEVGVGFCMASPVARAMSECDFFSCDTREENDKVLQRTQEEFADDFFVGDDKLLDLQEEQGQDVLLKKFKDNFPLDPRCFAAGMGSDNAKDVCNSTIDGSGKSCVWCNAAGVYGLCLSQDAVDMAHDYIQCDSAVRIE